MAGISLDAHDDGSEVEVPMGLELTVALPPADEPWQVQDGTTLLQVEGVDASDDGTTVRLSALGLGDTTLLVSAGSRDYRLRVVVVEPLMND